ncbi:hypothetical protein VKT23_014783 [Stygiomarasmius scandens]|uniref:Uncharacterized protein n=1 Tax=Marasmiellus scandens TaxID=2682957 RepID=A0ABR1J4E2_9AGAR
MGKRNKKAKSLLQARKQKASKAPSKKPGHQGYFQALGTERTSGPSFGGVENQIPE